MLSRRQSLGHGPDVGVLQSGQIFAHRILEIFEDVTVTATALQLEIGEIGVEAQIFAVVVVTRHHGYMTRLYGVGAAVV